MATRTHPVVIGLAVVFTLAAIVGAGVVLLLLLLTGGTHLAVITVACLALVCLGVGFLLRRVRVRSLSG